jgi:hypothetical protein
MSFLRHEQICHSDGLERAESASLRLPRHKRISHSDGLDRKVKGEAQSGSAPDPLIVMTSLRPAIPRRVALQQSPPPLHQPSDMVNQVAETVNHHQARGGEFSTGILGNFQPVLTRETIPRFGRELLWPPRGKAAESCASRACAGRIPLRPYCLFPDTPS